MHHNNFGFLRLFLATLVIVSHSSEMIDGNNSRELLSNILGHRSFGEIAVDGFFLISGYLVTKSFVQSDSAIGYLSKRVRRIYPGYIVCYAICIFIVGSLTGADLLNLSWHDIFHAVVNALALQGPWAVPGFIGLRYEDLNGSMWTISYEFRCYLLVLALGLLGFFRVRWLFLALTGLILLLTMSHIDPYVSPRAEFVIGSIGTLLRLANAFFVGACFFLFRKNIPLKAPIAAGCFVGLLCSMYLGIQEIAAFSLFGGYIVFWFAFGVHNETVANINSKNDISYGVYLYAWPIAGMLIYFCSIRSPWLIFLLTVPLSYIAGWLSWRFVERPFVRRVSTRNATVASV